MMKKVLFTFILSVTFCVVQGSHPDFADEQKQAGFVALYRQYLDSFSEDEELDFLEGFKRGVTLGAFKTIVSHLNIEFSLQQMRDIYDRTGFIQFRAIDFNLRTLVIGCGNRPFSYFAGYQRELVFDELYSNAHAHRGAITVDPDPKNNPTIVAFFGVRPLSVCAENSFDKILIEGVSIPALLELEHFVSDLKRLLTENGRLYLEYNDGPFRVSFNGLSAFGRAWNEWDLREGRGPNPLDEMAERNRRLLPTIFKNMIDTYGQQEVEGVFGALLKGVNWVHVDMTWGESFSTISEKAGEHNALLAPLKSFFGYPPAPFTSAESRLIRLAAMELGVL